jgi:predicted N-acetyltransferase YhbS
MLWPFFSRSLYERGLKMFSESHETRVCKGDNTFYKNVEFQNATRVDLGLYRYER